MTVENTNPIQHFTANGTTTVFAINFEVEGKDNIKVTVDGTTVSINDYSYDALVNAVVFNTAPAADLEVIIERVTSLDRSINYQTYNNSFRPETLNYDLDRIWHVLQEDHITDAEILARIKDEIEWRRTHNTEWDLLAQAREGNLFNALKSYMDTIGAMSVPNLFDGVTDNVVITEEGVSQRVTNRALKQAQAELHTSMTDLEQSTTAYVDTEKARAIQVETDLGYRISAEENRAKVEEQTLQVQINTLGVGNRAYKTYVDMTADTTNIPSKSKVTVTNDSDTTKNGDYQYDGTVFTKSAYDLKTYVDSNPLFKPGVLTSSTNLNTVITEGLYKPTTGVPALNLNYPVTGLGELHVRNITGNVCVQTYWVYGTFGQWIRTTDGSGVFGAWEQLGTKSVIDSWILTAKSPVNLTGVNNTDLNTLIDNRLYAVYSTNEVSVSNFPKKGIQGFVLCQTLTNVTNQIFLVRGTNEMFIRALWGTNGWTTWEKLATSNELTVAINTAIAALPLSKYDNLIYSQNLDELLRNPLKSTRIKLIGDSITWGMGSSAASSTEPRTGYLTDPRNSTVFTSKTWANLLRQWIAKVYGSSTIVEDSPGSAYTSKALMTQWREIYKSVKMTSNADVVLTDTQKLAVIDTNINFNTGTCINLLSSTFATALRPQIMEFDITADNLTVMYQKQNVGDANDIVEIYVDNTLVDSFNYYSDTTDYTATKSISFTHGKRTIKLINKATNASSYCRIAGFKVDKKSWVINEGIVGLSTATLLSRNILESTLDGYDDVILFMLGTNDRAEAGGTEGFKKRLNDSLDKIATLSPNSKVILMSSTYASVDAPTSPYKFDMGIVDKIISTVARERNLIFISQYKGCTQALIDGETIWSDGLHLNDNGNKIYYQNIKNTLLKN